MTTPLIPPDTSNLDATLVRRWAIQVNTGTLDTPVWTWVRGINSFEAPVSNTLQETGDFHSGVWGAQISTEKSWTATIGVGRKLDPTGAPDPGVEFLRAKGLQVGADGLAEIRFWRTDGLPDAYQGRGSVNFVSAGNDKTALQGGTITLTGYGALTAIAKPTQPDTATSIAVSPIEATIAVGDTLQLTVTDNNDALRTADCEFESSEPTDATVSATGVVTGVAAGTVTITATLGALTDTAEITVA